MLCRSTVFSIHDIWLLQLHLVRHCRGWLLLALDRGRLEKSTILRYIINRSCYYRYIINRSCYYRFLEERPCRRSCVWRKSLRSGRSLRRATAPDKTLCERKCLRGTVVLSSGQIPGVCSALRRALQLPVYEIDISRPGVEVAVGPNAVELSCDGGSAVNLNEALIFYFPFQLSSEFPVASDIDPEIRGFVGRQWTAFRDFLLAAYGPRFLPNPIGPLQLWSSKLFQLWQLTADGERIPSYFVSNSMPRIKAAGLARDLVAKHISEGRRINDDLFAQTSRLSLDALAEGADVAPFISQAFISAEVEFRAFFLDGEICLFKFARVNFDDIADLKFQYEGQRVPAQLVSDEQISEAAIRIVSRTGLRYAALDFILDKSGRCFFLELNPLGSWDWMDSDSAAIVERKFSEMCISLAQNALAAR
jgi:hypothetical protein